ncbi:hypothetical protein GCG54_00008077 [Colletotrichum gloeosporioides]|uniref:Glycosyltransferase family 31 protein n=1 Tax=Colletotrichum gloeosporioides TaxID=474922 RepID=A0A8H4CMU3_COLGL|nr:uncharacterized protein GCG54_00008077 [Colletotrichum gloeosporioides]KAF3806562.1 hypothetical protein GCG54_00008077 [Colletotrichum gloeosporioides]
MMQPMCAYHNHARALHAATFLLVLLFILIQLVRNRQDAYEIIDSDPLVPVLKPQKASATTKKTDTDTYLRVLAERHGLTRNVSLFSQRVRAVSEASSRRSMTNLQKVFVDGDFVDISWDDRDLPLDKDGDTSLPVAISIFPDDVDASDLLFGVSTTYNRLSHANGSLIRDWQRWLTDGHGNSNGASIIVALYNTSIREAWQTHDKFKDTGIDATVLMLDDDLDKVSRHFEIVDILLEVNKALTGDGQTRKYLGLIEDDIFFPTLGQLVSKLSQFDARDPFYIGLPSERPDWSVEDEEAVTHGGGAVFFTLPAAKVVSELPCLSPDRPPFANTTTWDSALHECVTKNTDMPLHVLSSFYSPRDVLYHMQAPTYDLGISPLTLRHSQSRHHFSPSRGHLVTSVCGEACFLQRFRFADDWVLVNGYSLTHYCAGFEVEPMSSGAVLQGAMQYGLEAELPLGEGLVLDERDEPKEIITWRGTRNVWSFLDAVVGDEGEVLQLYVKKGGLREVDDEEHEEDILDSVIVLVWES